MQIFALGELNFGIDAGASDRQPTGVVRHLVAILASQPGKPRSFTHQTRQAPWNLLDSWVKTSHVPNHYVSMAQLQEGEPFRSNDA